MPIDEQLMTDVVGWDVGTWSTAVRFWETVVEPMGGPLDVLEVGAGPGGVSLWLALAGHRVTCTNYDFTVEQAKPLHERYGVADRVEYRDLDILDLPYENRFDLVVFKSVLGGIPDSDLARHAEAFAQVRKVLKPGGRLIFAENLRGTVIHQLARRIAYRVRRVHMWRYITLREYRRLLSDFEGVELRVTGFLGLFGQKESLRAALSRVDSALLNRAVPASWHYVVYGTAVKPVSHAEVP
jgi:SAM-dependent methyltransferase